MDVEMVEWLEELGARLERCEVMLVELVGNRRRRRLANPPMLEAERVEVDRVRREETARHLVEVLAAEGEMSAGKLEVMVRVRGLKAKTGIIRGALAEVLADGRVVERPGPRNARLFRVPPLT